MELGLLSEVGLKKHPSTNMSSWDKRFIQHEFLIIKGIPLFLLFLFLRNSFTYTMIYDRVYPTLQFQHIPINMPLPLHAPFVFDSPLYPIGDTPMSGVKPDSGAWDLRNGHILIKKMILSPSLATTHF